MCGCSFSGSDDSFPCRRGGRYCCEARTLHNSHGREDIFLSRSGFGIDLTRKLLDVLRRPNRRTRLLVTDLLLLLL